MIKFYIKNKYLFNIKYPIKVNKKYFVITSTILIFLSIYNFGIGKFIIGQIKNSNIYENYYVDPKSVKYTFPEQKQNLIYIYLESMESSFNNYLNNGKNVSLISELGSLENEGINFSNSNSLGGALGVTGTGWTIAGMVAQTAGINLALPIDSNSLISYDSFLSGAYSLGEVLENNGYNNYLLLGSDADFGGRSYYFREHGNYEILDYKNAISDGFIPSDYHVWWGYEDSKLFKRAKNELNRITKNNEPFNFTILTADTHFQNGFTDKDCDILYDNSYANSIACSSRRVYDFVKWVQKQDFYKNTTVIISGDHLTMQYGKFTDLIDSNRTIYNVILNSRLTTQNNKNRLFSTIDFYPTTLASLGVTFDSNRLGLGTNLYTEEKTLIEKLGIENINKELSVKSKYYNNNIVK